MSTHEPTCIWPAGAELGEGPMWHAATGSVYFVDIKGRQVHRCAEDGTQRRSWSAPGMPGFIVPASGNTFVCALENGLYRFCEETGEFTTLRSVEDDIPGNRFNDGSVDAQGCLWFGSMDNGEEVSSGSLYRIDRSGALATADSGYVITNGPAMSPDGTILYHTDTLKKEVYAFDVTPEGALSGKRLFVAIAGSGYPDGMAVDADGYVWIALFGGGRIERYSPEGKLVDSVLFPCSNVTKLAFGGADLRTVFATTAWKGLSPEQREREPLAGGLFRFRTATPGLTQHEFSIQDFA
jgi:xylono-1,5-lactonase